MFGRSPRGLRAWRLVPASAILLAIIARAGSAGDLEDARRLRAQERWAASGRLAAAALDRLERSPAADSLEMAEALFLIGESKAVGGADLDRTGLRSAARCLSIRERRLGADHLEVAEAHLLVGRLLRVGERPDSALFHVRRALELRRARLQPGDTLLADAYAALALTQQSRRDLDAALDAWNRAIQIREQAQGPEHPAVAVLLSRAGVCWFELDDPDRARELTERGLAIFDRTGANPHPLRWVSLYSLANIERGTGNPSRSLDLLEQTLSEVKRFQGEDSPNLMPVRRNLIGRLLELADFAGVRALATELLPATEASHGRRHPTTTTLRRNLALACVFLGDTAMALRNLAEVEADMTREGPPAPGLAITVAWQGELLRWQGRYAEARVYAERGVRLSRAERRPTAESASFPYYVLITILASLGDTTALDSARHELARIAQAHNIGASFNAQEVPYYDARAAQGLGRSGEAWARALEAEGLARAYVLLNARTLSDRRCLEFSRQKNKFLDFVVGLAGEDPERVPIAWDRLVRNRGLVRVELQRRRVPPELRSDSSLAAAHRRWVDAQRRYAQRLVGASGARLDSAEQAGIERLRLIAEEAERAHARSLAEHRLQPAPPDPGLDDLRTRLKAGHALVSFSFAGDAHDQGGDPRMIAFIARGGDPRVERLDLGRLEDLRLALEAWLERLATPPEPGAGRGSRAERECRRLGREVRALTWDRIAPRIAEATDVFLVADDPLLDLPWQALPDGADAFLVETGPRLHLLNAERELAAIEPASSSSGLLAIGAPDFGHRADQSDETPPADRVRASLGPCAEGTMTALTPLPGSGLEAQDAARAWPGTGRDVRVLLAAEATESSFKREASGRSVVHLATHGVVARDTCAVSEPGVRGVGGLAAIAGRPPRPKPPPSAAESPWMGRRVWLALAGADRAHEYQRDENEGLLTAEEVVTLDLQGTEWVVLSACHSGLAESWSREGALGMRRAFHLAGARTVIASQWNVGDQSAREWMRALYAARRSDAPTAQALRMASRGVLAERRRSGRSTHPFYWAAFTATGE